MGEGSPALGCIAGTVLREHGAVLADPAGTQGEGGPTAVSSPPRPFLGHDAYAGTILRPDPAAAGIEPQTPGRFLQTGGHPLAGGGHEAGGIRGDPDLPGPTSTRRAPASAPGAASAGRYSAGRGDPAPELAPGFFPAQSGCSCRGRAGVAARWFCLRATECIARRLAAVAGRSDRGARPGCQSARERRLARIRTPQHAPEPRQARCQSPKSKTNADDRTPNLNPS